MSLTEQEQELKNTQDRNLNVLVVIMGVILMPIIIYGSITRVLERSVHITIIPQLSAGANIIGRDENGRFYVYQNETWKPIPINHP